MSDISDRMPSGCALIIGIVIVVVSVAFVAKQAEVQRDVYHRQGVEMTTTEILLGAKPIERVITIKEKL